MWNGKHIVIAEAFKIAKNWDVLQNPQTLVKIRKLQSASSVIFGWIHWIALIKPCQVVDVISSYQTWRMRVCQILPIVYRLREVSILGEYFLYCATIYLHVRTRKHVTEFDELSKRYEKQNSILKFISSFVVRCMSFDNIVL